MLKAFCDLCKAECDLQKSGTRRFETIKGFLGFELIQLSGSKPSTGHLCNDCVSELLVLAALRNASSPTAKNYTRKSLLADEFLAKQKEFESELAQVRSDAAKIRQIARQADEALTEIQNSPKEGAEKIKVLTAQVEALTQRTQQKETQEKAAQAQVQADAKDYPEYIDATKRRERIRASK